MFRARGFTLIETLVTVTIIMILSAIVYPVYEVVNKRAEAVHCANNLHHLAEAVSLYAEDYDGVLVPARVSYGPTGTLGTSWDVLLMPYHRSELLYKCLSDQTPNFAASTVCYNHSYGINLDVTMVGGYNGSALCFSQLESPTETLIFFEILGSARALGASYPTHKLSRVDPRHNDGANFAFMDGHVKWLQPRGTCLSNETNMWYP
jgi:prepilin-type processing-associated H-X9-DG protein/prepilin-type N-terminal cleavage/methylation domain-containing protein